MVNEMGNNNVLGLKEEESIVKAPEIVLHESVHAVELKGENDTNSELAQEQDFHEKDDIEEETKMHSTADESNGAASLGSGVLNVSHDISDAEDEKNLVNQNSEDNIIGISILRVHKEIPVGSEETETSYLTADSKSESHEVDLKSDQHENVHAELLVNGSRISPGDSEELVGLRTSFQPENVVLQENEITENIDSFVLERNIANEVNDVVEKCKTSEEEYLLESDSCDGQIEGSSPKEAAKGFINSLQEVSEQLVLTEVTELLTENEIESEENKFDINQTQLYEGGEYFETNDSNASQSELMIKDPNCKESARVKTVAYGIGEGLQVEESVLNNNEPQVGFVDRNLKLETVKESKKTDGVADRLCELEIVPSVFNGTDRNDEENRPSEEIRDQVKDSHTKKYDIPEQCMPWPISTEDVQEFTPQVLDSKADDNGKELISNSEQNVSEFFIVIETLNLSVDNAQAILSTPEKELPQNVQSNPVTIAESEQRSQAQESIEKLITESNSETSRINVVLKKSPSVHFDLSIGGRSEDSEKTPLLFQEKATSRSLPTRDNAKFVKDKTQPEYSPPQDEAMPVEEKTIRMERSDSERPTSPFLSLLKNEENAKVPFEPEKQDSNGKSSWAVTTKQVPLTSPQYSTGKRRMWPTLFTTCICCSNPIP